MKISVSTEEGESFEFFADTDEEVLEGFEEINKRRKLLDELENYKEETKKNRIRCKEMIDNPDFELSSVKIVLPTLTGQPYFYGRMSKQQLKEVLEDDGM